MFKDMAADTYLASAGIADDWPYGRGCWQSDDKQCIVWFGEEDQLRIMCMKRGTKLNEVFDRLKKMLDTIESIDGIDLCGNKIYGAVVLNRRVDLHAIDATPARWRGDTETT